MPGSLELIFNGIIVGKFNMCSKTARILFIFRGAINPARDLAPRFFSLLMFGREAFSNSFFLVPTIGPIIGGILAAIVYCLFISVKGVELLNAILIILHKLKKYSQNLFFTTHVSAHWPETEESDSDSETVVVKLDKV